MASPKMGSLKFLKMVVCIAVMVVDALDSAESVVIIHFHRAPPEHSRFSSAVFEYSVVWPDGTNACKNNGCYISCELDGKPLRSCPADIIVFKNLTVNHKHNFLLNATTHDGEKNSSSYSWFIDTVPPTATIFSEKNFTTAGKATIDVTFSEACTGLGGFKCVNSSNCNVVVDGPAYVNASSLRIIKPKIKYRLDIIILSLKTIYGRIIIRMADDFCADKAGNSFRRSSGSITIIHYDRRPVLVDLWMPVPSYVLEINGVPRSVYATNKMEDLKIFLDFSIPIKNSTEEILSALQVNSGNIIPFISGNHGNRKFAFELKNVASTEIITVELDSALVIGRTGNPVSPVASLTILYDSIKPEVGLSTSTPNVTKSSNMNVIVEFTKPVFGFEASMVEVEGGKVTRFEELSRALYSLTILAVTENMITITVPGGKVNDISGNQNSASNQLEVKYYSAPATSMVLHSFVTAGVLATSLTAVALSLSSANLGAIGSNVASSPSMNLHGLFGHLQVFVLSDWLSTHHPIEYSETIKGLRWLIPRQKLPWKEDYTSIWPDHIYLAEEKFRRTPVFLYHGQLNCQFGLNLTKSSNVQRQQPALTDIGPIFARLHGHNISMRSTPYGQPLNSREYFTYFLRGEPMSGSNAVRRMENHKGWQDLGMNLFWLGVGGASLLIIHVLILLFLRWRTGTPAHGILSVPRFELLLLILMLPCISQSSAFVIRGGTMGGIIIGALLLAIPAALILSVCLFLIIAIFSGSLAQYKEIRYIDISEPLYTKLWSFFIGRPVTGKWFYREGLPASFLSRFGILFENLRGPPYFVFVDQNDPNTIPKWTESSQSGIGRMRAVSSDDSYEEINMPLSRRLMGCARSFYVVLDLVRRVMLGIISGAYSFRASSQILLALAITLTQFIYLLTLKPYIRRGVHLVENISLLCEIGIFGLSIATKNSNPVESSTLGYIMLALLLLTFIAQIINEWYAMIKFLLRLSQPQKNSFRFGLKFAAKGLVVPFLPRKYWSRIIPSSSQPKTGLSAVPPLSPETEIEGIERRVSAMTATVVPVLSPGSPGPSVIQATSSATAEATVTGQRVEEGKRLKGPKLEQMSELKKLRELAKASFSGDFKGEERTRTRYAFRHQFDSPETSNNPQASTSNARH